MTTYENGDPIISIVPIAVFMDHRLTANEMRVLGAILSFRNKDSGICSVKRETLASRCNLPLTKISTFTTSLVKKGWLVKDGSGGFSKASTYRITVPDLVTVTDPVTVTEMVTTTVTESVTSTVTEMVTGKEQSKNKVRTEKKREQVACSISASEMTELTSDLAIEFLAYRKAKKAPLTPTAWKGIQREAEKAGWTITAAVEETITRGWQSFKADWVTQKTPQAAPSRTRKVFNPVRAA